MHFHHRHDIAGCVDPHNDWPDWAVAILATLDRMEIQIMTAVQADLDAATTVITELVAEVESLKAAQAPALDSAALNAEVAAAQAVLNPAPAAPAADPSAPADPSQPPADQPVPSVPLA